MVHNGKRVYNYETRVFLGRGKQFIQPSVSEQRFLETIDQHLAYPPLGNYCNLPRYDRGGMGKVREVSSDLSELAVRVANAFDGVVLPDELFDGLPGDF